MDMNVIFGFYKSSLRYQGSLWTTNVLWSSFYLYQVLWKAFYCKDSKFVEFEIIDNKKPSAAYVEIYKIIT